MIMTVKATATLGDAIGHAMKGGTFSFKPRDAILYALGIGVSTQHKGFLRFLFEHDKQFTCMPTYGTLVGNCGIVDPSGEDLPVTIDPPQLLHGEHYLEILKPLGAGGHYTTKAKIVDVLDKGRGAVFVTESETFDEKGDQVLRNQAHVYVKGMGNYSGKRHSTVAVGLQEHPKRAPDASIQEQTSVNQAALFRLCDDNSPRHIDPEFTAKGGFDRPLLHGLCVFGYAGRHVMQQYCDNDPSRFKAIKARFSKPVLPGQTLRTDMWKEGPRIHFTTTVVENGSICLSGAYVDIMKPTTPKVHADERSGQTHAKQKVSGNLESGLTHHSIPKCEKSRL